MREIEASLITKTIARLCQEANFFLPEDMLQALRRAFDRKNFAKPSKLEGNRKWAKDIV